MFGVGDITGGVFDKDTASGWPRPAQDSLSAMEQIRQLIVPAATSAAASLASKCSAVNLPAGGVIDLVGQDPFTLTADAVFKPQCTQSTSPIIIANGGVSLDETVSTSGNADVGFSDFRDPFYASTFPQCYALAATTVIAYTLVIMLFITPRSFLDGGVVVLGRSGFTSGGTGGQNIGGRPWLQKVAATFVAVSLTIATVDTFRVAEEQYAAGVQNAAVLQQDVLGGTELKVIKIISEAFLWLAQAQTLIRLFPRQREKIIIKWTAFALIGFGVLFDSLNSFMYTNAGSTRPRSFTDAIPALSYLFQLSLGVLYAAWVVYYSLMKKHYAYYHPQMRNIGLVAILSITAVLVPIVFFILDICKPDFTGWGDYVRWVGAAAASVIVWEWVERIEALEREEKKDGILGREVFDGDEMLGMSASEFSWPRKRKNTKRDDFDDGGENGGDSKPQDIQAPSGKTQQWPIVSSIATRYRQRSRSRPRANTKDVEHGSRGTGNGERGAIRFLQPPLWPSRPPPVATPVSRTDTASADSTVYAVRYKPASETTNTEPFTDSMSGPLPAVVPEVEEPRSRRNSSEEHAETADRALATTPEPSVTPSQSASQVAGQAAFNTTTSTSNVNPTNPPSANISRLRGLTHATQLLRKTSKPNLTSTEGSRKANDPSSQDANRWNFKTRFEDFAVSRAERLRERMRPEVDTETLPVTVIPAPPRRGAALQQLRDEEANAQQPRQGANRLAPPVLNMQASSSSHLTSTSPVTSGPVSPRMWRNHSGEDSEATPPSTHGSSSVEMTNQVRAVPESASNGLPEAPLSPVAAGKRPEV